MAILKKISLTLSLCVLLATTINAQDNNLVDAFKKSYTHEKAGEYTKATAALKAVYDADNYALNLRLGWLDYLAGLFTESMSYYQKAMKLMPLSIEARLGYVLPAAAAGNAEQVKNQYLEILKIDPNNSTANYRLGVIYYGKGDYNLAYKHLEKVVNLYPFDYDSLVMFAWINLKLGRMHEAEVLFRTALLNRPGDASALEGLSNIR